MLSVFLGEWNDQPERFADIPERSPLVENYLKGGAKLVMNINYNDDPFVTITTKKGKTVEFGSDKLKKEDAAQYRQFMEKKLEMIEPPTKTELTLMKQIHQLTSNYDVKTGKKLLEAVNNTAAMYIAEKQKENKNFGKESMFERLNDLRKRSIVEDRMQDMQILQASLKKNGR